MTVSRRHRWGRPARFYRDSSRDGHREHVKSERECDRCGLIKVSRHEGASHWIEFWRDEMRLAISGDRTPACGARNDAGTG